MHFGAAGVKALEPTRVGIVGSGYLGCRIARELGRIRVEKLTLLDDRVARRPYISSSFAVGCVEEFVWRGYLIVYFIERVELDTLWALVAASGMFGLHHAALGLRSCAAKTVHGMVWSLMFIMTGSLAPSAVSHMVFQYMVWRHLAGSATLQHADRA